MPRRSAVEAAFPISASQRLRPPADLAPEQKREFISLVLALPADHFRQSDLPMVCAYCKVIVAERHAAARLNAEPVTADGKPSAWLPVWQASIRVLTTLSRQMHLSPNGRASIKASADKQGLRLSYYDQMALEREHQGDDASN